MRRLLRRSVARSAQEIGNLRTGMQLGMQHVKKCTVHQGPSFSLHSVRRARVSCIIGLRRAYDVPDGAHAEKTQEMVVKSGKRTFSFQIKD